jgi:hypothetical protein
MSRRFIHERWWKTFATSAGINHAGEEESSSLLEVARVAKFTTIDIPKWFLVEAVWGGFAEGLGIREERPMAEFPSVGKGYQDSKGNLKDDLQPERDEVGINDDKMSQGF